LTRFFLPHVRNVCLGLVSLAFLASGALAQSPVSVIGPITSGNCPQFSSNTVLKDSGFPCSGAIPVNVQNFGAKGDGVTDNTTAIQNAMTAAALRNACVYFPASANPYLTGLITGQTLSCWLGDGPNATIIKSKNSANSGLFTAGTSGTEANDVSLSNLTLDGNMANNTSGDTLVIYGNRPRLINIIVQNSPGTGITTTSNIADGAITDSVEGYFSNVRIDSTQHHGWFCQGPNDSYFAKIAIEDAGLATDNTYFAMILNPASGGAAQCNGRFNDLHTFNRDATTNTPFEAVAVGTGGNNFVNSHFEGGHLPLAVTGNNNIIQGAVYGTRGPFAASVTGSGNVFDLLSGLVAASVNPHYKCFQLAGTLNIVRITAGACDNGIIDFTADGGFNNVTIDTFNGASIVNEFVGTPAISDAVIIQAGGTSAVQLWQLPQNPWTAYTPVVVCQTGTITTLGTVTGRYQLTGKQVGITISIPITTVGSCTGFVSATVPLTAKAGAVLSGTTSSSPFPMLEGVIQASGGNAQILTAAGVSPAASGATLTMSGVYEAQ
jgi:hypothetical protein